MSKQQVQQMLKDPEVLNILRSAQAEEAPHERLKVDDKPKEQSVPRYAKEVRDEIGSPLSGGGNGTVNYDFLESEAEEDSSMENLAL